MFKNDSMPVAVHPETSNTNKSVTAVKTVLRKSSQISLPSMRKKEDYDSRNSFENKNGSNGIKIISGIPLKKVYNIENAEVLNLHFIKKGKTDLKSKAFDKKHHSQAKNREHIKKSPKRRELNNPQSKKQLKQSSLRLQEKREQKLRMEEQQRKEEKRRRRSEEIRFDESQCNQESTRSLLFKRKNVENRLTTKIWQILSRDAFLLDHDKFSSQIQATNSETKKYILSVIKKCNTKELKRQNPPKVTQTGKESSYHAGKRAIKCAVRRRVWQLAKVSIKHSKHWSQFLAENNIILENINIDKLDLSLIDLDALGIENKIVKRTITWLFK